MLLALQFVKYHASYYNRLELLCLTRTFFRPFGVTRATPLWPTEFPPNSSQTEDCLQM